MKDRVELILMKWKSLFGISLTLFFQPLHSLFEFWLECSHFILSNKVDFAEGCDRFLVSELWAVFFGQFCVYVNLHGNLNPILCHSLFQLFDFGRLTTQNAHKERLGHRSCHKKWDPLSVGFRIFDRQLHPCHLFLFSFRLDDLQFVNTFVENFFIGALLVFDDHSFGFLSFDLIVFGNVTGSLTCSISFCLFNTFGPWEGLGWEKRGSVLVEQTSRRVCCVSKKRPASRLTSVCPKYWRSLGSWSSFVVTRLVSAKKSSCCRARCSSSKKTGRCWTRSKQTSWWFFGGVLNRSTRPQIAKKTTGGRFSRFVVIWWIRFGSEKRVRSCWLIIWGHGSAKKCRCICCRFASEKTACILSLISK